MRINMSRWLIVVASIVIIGCSSDNIDEMYGSGYVVVSEQTWEKSYTTSYPFTMPKGEIACASNPAFSREVYFHPKVYTDESYIGTPLNKSAVVGLQLGRLTSNVAYSLKEGADLSEAVKTGLRVCHEFENKLANS